MKNDIKFTDVLGNEINAGDVVAYADGSLNIGIVDKLTPKMVKINKRRVEDKKYRSRDTVLKYPTDVIVIDPKVATMYFLKN